MLTLNHYLVVLRAMLGSLGSPRLGGGRLRRPRRHLPTAAANPLPDSGRPGDLLHIAVLTSGVDLHCVNGVLRIEFVADGVVRVRFSRSGSFPPLCSYAVVDNMTGTRVRKEQEGATFTLSPLQPAPLPATLRVSVSPSPCRLSFLDAGGRVLCADTDAGWQDEGVTCSLHLPEGMALYGLGEKAFGLNHRGRRLTMWNTDPRGGYRTGTDPLYQSIPFLIGQQDGVAFGLLFDNPWRACFDLGHSDPHRLLYHAEGGELCYYVLAGPSPADVLARYADLTGHMALPPRWALGYHQSRWSYINEAEVRQVAGELRRRSIPCDALYLDIDHMDGYRVFTWDHRRFPDPARLLADLRREGLRVVLIVDPGVKADPGYAVCAEGLARDLFCKLPDGTLYAGPVWPGRCYFPDFANPVVRAWWGDLYRPLLEMGVAGFWNDMNEPAVFPGTTFPDVVQHQADGGPGDGEVRPDTTGEAGTDRLDHRGVHNVYGLLMARACAEGLRRWRPTERPFVISRAAYAGIQRYALVWTGDNRSDWEHLRLSIPMVLNLGMSGQPFAGPDVGGFGGDADGELLTRWTQLGAFMPFFRNHSAMGTTRQEPYAFGEPYESICRRYIELRYRLLPYIYTAFWQAATRGMPVARPLAFAFPADRRTASMDDEYLFGDALLVAPILERGARGRGVYLPAGGWYDFWSGERPVGRVAYPKGYGPQGTSLAESEGADMGFDVPAHAPLDLLPLYARAGSVVPMGPVMQYTDQFVPAVLDLHLFPGDGQSWLYEDDGHSTICQGIEPEDALRKQRVTRFVMQTDENGMTLTRVSEGSYDPGYRGYDLLLRGWEGDNLRETKGRRFGKVRAVLIDGKPAQNLITDPEWGALRVPAGMFERLEVHP